jgi:hypothetical protein
MAEDPTTWAGLKTSARAWLSDIDTGGVSDEQLEEFIAFAERHFQRTIFTPDREEALSITADAQSEALPSDFWGFKSGPYVDDTADVVLTRMSPETLRSSYPTSATGTPANFAIEGENILFGPIPAASTSVKGTYWKTISPLSSGTASNWLSTDHPDAYLAGTLHYAYLFLLDESRATFWKGKLEELISDINRAGSRRSNNSGPLVASASIGNIPNIQA